MDMKKVLRFGIFEWFSNKETLKYGAFAALFSILLSFIVPLLTQFFFPQSLFESEMTSGVITTLVLFILFVFVLIAIATIVMMFIQYKIFYFALKQKKYKPVELDGMKFVKFVFFVILESLAAIFSIYNLKFLLVGVGSILFTLIGFGLLMFFDSNRIATLIGALLLVLAVLLFFGYILIVIYNGYRLILAMPIFVANKYGVLQCLKKSWDLTRGNVLSVFISVLIVSLMIFGVTYVISFPASIYSLFLELNAANTATVVAAFDPIYLILLIPSQIISAVGIIVSTYVLIGLYDELDK